MSLILSAFKFAMSNNVTPSKRHRHHTYTFRISRYTIITPRKYPCFITIAINTIIQFIYNVCWEIISELSNNTAYIHVIPGEAITKAMPIRQVRLGIAHRADIVSDLWTPTPDDQIDTDAILDWHCTVHVLPSVEYSVRYCVIHFWPISFRLRFSAHSPKVQHSVIESLTKTHVQGYFCVVIVKIQWFVSVQFILDSKCLVRVQLWTSQFWE